MIRVKTVILTLMVCFLLSLALNVVTGNLYLHVLEQKKQMEVLQNDLNTYHKEQIDKLRLEIETLKQQQEEKDKLYTVADKVDSITKLGKPTSLFLVRECERKKIPLSVMLAIYDIESGFNPSAKNPKSTATGLGQIIHSTARATASRIGESFRIDKLTDAVYNIKLTTSYLAHIYDGNWKSTVKAYGEGTEFYANKVMNKEREYSRILGTS